MTSCERCGGQVFIDDYLNEEVCLQCGRRQYLVPLPPEQVTLPPVRIGKRVKFDPTEAAIIRRDFMRGMTIVRLAKKYKCSKALIGDVVNFRNAYRRSIDKSQTL